MAISQRIGYTNATKAVPTFNQVEVNLFPSQHFNAALASFATGLNNLQFVLQIRIGVFLYIYRRDAWNGMSCCCTLLIDSVGNCNDKLH